MNGDTKSLNVGKTLMFTVEYKTINKITYLGFIEVLKLLGVGPGERLGKIERIKDVLLFRGGVIFQEGQIIGSIGDDHHIGFFLGKLLGIERINISYLVMRLGNFFFQIGKDWMTRIKNDFHFIGNEKLLK
jgi:hypothetical protein